MVREIIKQKQNIQNQYFTQLIHRIALMLLCFPKNLKILINSNNYVFIILYILITVSVVLLFYLPFFETIHPISI